MRTLEPGQREKLVKLARLQNFMEDIPTRVNMHRWCGPDVTVSSCGTTGCEAGWAATVFHDEGWYFGEESAGGRIPIRPGYQLETVFSCFSDFFGISRHEAVMICDPSAYDDEDRENQTQNGRVVVTARDAVRRARAIIAEYDPSILTEADTHPALTTPAPVGVAPQIPSQGVLGNIAANKLSERLAKESRPF